MTPEQIDELKEHVAETVKTVVNGKIDRLNLKLDNYIDSDMVWKEEYTPYIKGLANISGSAKIIVWIALGISACIGAFIGIKEFFK